MSSAAQRLLSPVRERHSVEGLWPPGTVEAIVALLQREAGIEVGTDRLEFIRARLRPRLVALGLEDASSYLKIVREDAHERHRLVEALTTHTTSFFREAMQYGWLAEEGVERLLGAGAGHDRPLTVWSAACSTGQEGYSALMVLEDARAAGRLSVDARLIGTDISAPILTRAARAIYSEEECRDLPTAVRRRYFMASRNGDGRSRLVPELRKKATWRRCSLTADATLGGIAADVAFLRNVLIYFGADTRTQVVDAVVRRLRPGGFLLCGQSEAGAVRHPELAREAPSIFRKLG